MSDQYTPERIPLSAALWKEVMFLDNFTCIYCGVRSSDMTVDHFIPVSLGGPEIIQNLVACCSTCNTKKGARAPYECGLAPRFGRYSYVVREKAPDPNPNGYETIVVGGHPVRVDKLAAMVGKTIDEVRRAVASTTPESPKSRRRLTQAEVIEQEA